MKPLRKRRLTIVLMIIFGLGAAIGLGLFAMKQNINLFYSPTEIAEKKAPEGVLIRLGGVVVVDSVQRDTETLKVQFQLTDKAEQVTVSYDGILPDLFREGQGIIAIGALTPDGHFEADEVLAKHDENYMPPEVADALEKSGHTMKENDQ